MKILHGILCKDVVVDATTRNASYLNIIDQVHVSESPPYPDTTYFLPFGAKFVTVWELEPEDKDGSVYEGLFWIELPNGERVMETVIQTAFNEFRRMRNIVDLTVGPYRGPGRYAAYMKSGNEVAYYAYEFVLGQANVPVPV